MKTQPKTPQELIEALQDIIVISSTANQLYFNNAMVRIQTIAKNALEKMNCDKPALMPRKTSLQDYYVK